MDKAYRYIISVCDEWITQKTYWRESRLSRHIWFALSEEIILSKIKSLENMLDH
jgi:hypothetical protein